MTLEMKKKITIEGESKIGGVPIQGYRAEINEVDPENLVMSDWIISKAGYKENRVQVRNDAYEFEEAVFALQDELIAASEKTDEE